MRKADSRTRLSPREGQANVYRVVSASYMAGIGLVIGAPDGLLDEVPGLAWLRRDSVVQEPEHVVVRDLLAAVQEVELDDELEADDLAAELLDELGHRLRRAAGRQHIVVDQHTRAVLERVGLELERVPSVLEGVLRADRLQWKLAGPASRNEPTAELVRDRGSDEEPARLTTDDDVWLALGRPV